MPYQVDEHRNSMTFEAHIELIEIEEALYRLTYPVEFQCTREELAPIAERLQRWRMSFKRGME